MAQRTLESIKSHINGLKANSEVAISKFKADVDVNISYALEWSDGVYVAAAQQYICYQLERAMKYGEEHGATEEEIVAHIYDEARGLMMQYARSATNKSTGQGQNLMDTARIEVAAKFFGWLAMD